MTKNLDVAIIGSGPAGLAAALEFAKDCPDKKVLIFEKGPYRKERTADNLLCGIGGAGAFSDGKLTFSSGKGGELGLILKKERFEGLRDEAIETLSFFGGKGEIYGTDQEKIAQLIYLAGTFDLKVVPSGIKHFGTDRAPEIAKNITTYLLNKGIKILSETPVRTIKKEGGKFLLETGAGQIYGAEYIICAPGRSGAAWLASQAENLGFEIETEGTSVDIGFRVEVKADILKPLTDPLYDPKIVYLSKLYKDTVRTFCVCPYGEVVTEHYSELGITTVNGHSFSYPKSENTNFALLVTLTFTEPFREPIEFAQRIAKGVNGLAGEGNVLVQRLGDLRDGRRSTPERIDQGFVKPTLKEATPGDITLSPMPYRAMKDLLDMLEALNNIAPGVNGDHTLLYALEVKFYSNKIEISDVFESSVPNLYIAGDGSGHTRGYIQSWMSGKIAGRDVVDKILKKK